MSISNYKEEVVTIVLEQGTSTVVKIQENEHDIQHTLSGRQILEFAKLAKDLGTVGIAFTKLRDAIERKYQTAAADKVAEKYFPGSNHSPFDKAAEEQTIKNLNKSKIEHIENAAKYWD